MNRFEEFDLICFSHLRWGFVFQRPQHLLSRCAKKHRVFFIEEPVVEENITAPYIREFDSGVKNVTLLVPRITPNMVPEEIERFTREALPKALIERGVTKYVSWYYTPMALGWMDDNKALARVYDAMDELSAFKSAPPELKLREKELFGKVDLVFTGGISLYEFKKTQHHSVYAFPSSVDVSHFAKARDNNAEPDDQKHISHPRLGFFGVIDERLDTELIDGVAALLPHYQFVLLGPVVKIDPASLPKRDNIHYLGGKTYDELPSYISGWDVALMPFARNESTRFISPTKTPEYLAAGRPVVSTSIKDVVTTYGKDNLVHIADEPSTFAAECVKALNEDRDELMRRADTLLSTMSWDNTWRSMAELIYGAIERRLTAPAQMPTQITDSTEASHV